MNSDYHLALHVAFVGGKLVEVKNFLSICKCFIALYYLFGE